MSLSLTNSLISRLPISAGTVSSAFNKAVVTKRNLSRTIPNQFLFGKKPAKLNVEKLHIPNPSWKMGVPQKVPAGNTVEYSPNEIKDMLTFLMGTMPRSSNLISTVSTEGITNVAPIALCTCVSIKPPIIALTVTTKPTGKKDTQINIDDTKEFGVSIVNKDFIESSFAAGGEFPHNVSEFEKVGFTPRPSSIIKAPTVGQSPISFECKVVSRIPFKNDEGVEATVIYHGEIVKIHANDQVYDNKTGKYDYEKFGLVAKLGGLQYANVNSLIEIELGK